ncbi:MAG TPA: anthranilate synthase component I [Candidatus Krumholzibacteria bacterium]|nr:anthranilate synthase component I [Candidatus Krumholzibacteria bacterium]
MTRPAPDTAPLAPPERARIPADLETPVSVFLKLAPLGAAFLFESVERGIQMGRYSFIGLGPRVVISLKGEAVTIARTGAAAVTMPVDAADPFAPVKAELARGARDDGHPNGLPPAYGGAVGSIGYDMVRYFERVPLPAAAGGPDLPDYRFLFPSAIAVFDHVRNEIEFLVTPPSDDEAGRAAARRELDALLAALHAPLPADAHRPLGSGERAVDPALEANLDRGRYEAMVRRAKEHILAGDIFQIVLSQRLGGTTTASPFRIYRALRILNPSPYLFFLDFGDAQLVGSSPEMLVRMQDGRAQVNPIAGTRRRGATPAEDHRLEHELMGDEKERAEHVMLVDLGRNDLGRICTRGSVQVDDFMSVERYSHVMHIVSRVSGEVRPDCSAFDVLAATFPAGTVSGAPKIRAMEIIAELEPDRRGPYAGSVGYFGRGGDMDMCIAIRTLVMQGDRYTVQAGAGIVLDSDPAREYQETLDKIRALVRAVAIAEEER